MCNCGKWNCLFRLSVGCGYVYLMRSTCRLIQVGTFKRDLQAFPRDLQATPVIEMAQPPFAWTIPSCPAARGWCNFGNLASYNHENIAYNRRYGPKVLRLKPPKPKGMILVRSVGFECNVVCTLFTIPANSFKLVAFNHPYNWTISWRKVIYRIRAHLSSF